VIVGTLILSVIITLVINLMVFRICCKVGKRRKDAINTTAQLKYPVAPVSTSQVTIEPLYDDILLTDQNSSIDFSNNIAYTHTQN